MPHHARRRRLAAVATTAAIGALAVTPGADAATKKLSKAEKAQNTAIKKSASAAKKAAASAKKANTAAAKGILGAQGAATAATSAAAAAAAAAAKADGAQSSADTLSAGVPAITTALTKLSTALTSLADAAAAQEYGVVKVQVGGVDQEGAILTSSDIPDDTNGATLTGTVLATVPAGATATPVTLLAGVRSGESDGTGADDPVASAGIVTMSVASAAPGGLTVGGGNTSLAQAPITSAPNAADGGAPVYDIPTKAPRVDPTPNPFAFPTVDAIDLTDPAHLANLSGAGVGPFTVTNSAGTALPITVAFTVRFHDLTASSTDPTA